MNSLIKKASRYMNKLLYLCLFMSSFTILSQEKKPILTDFIIAEISVSGETVYGAETIITYSGLKKGESIKTEGGTKISAAIKKLWESNLFSSIEWHFPNTLHNQYCCQYDYEECYDFQKDFNQVTICPSNSNFSRKCTWQTR